MLSAPDDEPWDDWNTIRRCNPLVTVNPELKKTILRERDEARRNLTLRAAFEAYRLNRHVETARQVLIDAPALKAALSRPVPEREGNLIHKSPSLFFHAPITESPKAMKPCTFTITICRSEYLIARGEP